MPFGVLYIPQSISSLGGAPVMKISSGHGCELKLGVRKPLSVTSCMSSRGIGLVGGCLVVYSERPDPVRSIHNSNYISPF